MIEFLCPNGHRIHCPEDQAGRAARCPKCGVRFKIPDPRELADPGTIDGGSDVGRAQLTDSAEIPSPMDQPSAPPPEPQIEFLCPSGHRLHGPASLQGRPGECPECGTRFRIPNYEEVAEDEEGLEQDDISVGRADGAEGSDVGRREEPKPPPSAAGAATAAPAGGAPARHPMAILFARLWPLKARGATIELRLAGGEILRAERVARELSLGPCALLATEDSDGTYALHVVPWDHVEHVVVSGVKELPRELSG